MKTDKYIVPNGFIDKKTLFEMFEIDSKQFVVKRIIEGFNITTAKLGHRFIYKLDDVERAVKEIKDFCSQYYSCTQVVQDFNLTIRTLNFRNIYGVPMPKHYRGLLGKTCITSARSLFKKSDIDAIVESLANNEKRYTDVLTESLGNDASEYPIKFFDGEEYVDPTTATLMLNFSFHGNKPSRTISDISMAGFIKRVKGHRYVYYRVKDIKNLIEEREKYFQEHIPIGPVLVDYFSLKGLNFENYKRKLHRYDPPLQFKGCVGLYGSAYSRHGVCKKTDVDKLLKDILKRKSKTITTEQVGSTNFETFLIRLESLSAWNKGFEKKSSYTKQKVLDYIEHKLNSMKSKNKKVADKKIKEMIDLIISVRNLLSRYSIEEIYLLSSSQINLFIRSLNETQGKGLYLFLKSVNSDLKKLGLNNKLKFNFDKIINPSNKKSEDDLVGEWENEPKDLYNFETYSKVFNYLIDIDTHIPKIVDEFKNKNTIIHASVWLYAMLHLNNAWRNGDCTTFPELVINDLLDEYNIEKIDWFTDNKLTLPQSRAIIFRVRQWEMRISKTQINGAFFCSDELAPAFATAVIILHLYKYSHNIVSEYKEDSVIMDFGNMYNEATETNLKNFFKPAKIENFIFKSRKFNKSIMTYIYFLANLKGDDKALIYCAEVRKHLNIYSATNYVDFDISKVESLSKQLFSRGEFGYIPALLAEKVLGEGNTGTFEEMTNKVMEINAFFTDIQKINSTAKFLNIIRSERQNVVDMISEKSFGECQEIFTNLCTMDLPSKNGSDIQCLFSKQRCQMPNLDDKDGCSCFDCPYHIPTIYALTRLCNNLIDNYKSYLGLPGNVKLKDYKKYLLQNPETKSNLSKVSKMQTGLKIERRKVLLREAIQKLGPEYMYRCLDIDRESFIELSNIVRIDFYETHPELL